jgi:cytochrome c-type biogenesis protein CcmF
MSEDVWRRADNTFSGLRSIRKGYWGMFIAHMGVAVTVIGITMVTTYHVERDVRMTVGDHAKIGVYDFELAGLEDLNGPNYTGMQATVKVRKNGNIINTLYPEKRLYTVQKSMLSETAIDVTLFRDLYVAMGESLGDNAWSVRIYYKPFVRWIWLGGLFMALGGVLAALNKRSAS